ncbi:hypothetical protein MRX96_023416 [Rhipicephalus microplus]
MCFAEGRVYSASAARTARLYLSRAEAQSRRCTDMIKEKGGRPKRCRLRYCKARKAGGLWPGGPSACVRGLRRSSAICCASKRGIMERSLGDHSVSSNLRPRDKDGRCSASRGEEAHLLRPRSPAEEPQRLVDRSSSHCTGPCALVLGRAFFTTLGTSRPISRVSLRERVRIPDALVSASHVHPFSLT